MVDQGVAPVARREQLKAEKSLSAVVRYDLGDVVHVETRAAAGTPVDAEPLPIERTKRRARAEAPEARRQTMNWMEAGVHALFVVTIIDPRS